MGTNNQSTRVANISQIWNRLTSYLQNPFINLIVGVIITALFFYLVERKEIDAKYAVDNTELIAAQTLDAPELELFWDKEKINDISSVKIAFWNSGKQFLSTENISKTNPIRIIIPKGVRVLFAEVIETSRPTLRFSTTYNQETLSSDGVIINILDDEAMEHMDGGVVKILFTGKPESGFYVTGRILGNANGFMKSRWKSPDSWNVILSLVASLFQGILTLSVVRREQRRSMRITLIFFSVVMLSGFLLGSIYSFREGFFTFPDWIH